MGSPQSIISPYKEPSLIGEPEKKDEYLRNTMAAQREDASANCIGVLDVHVHQARDIHNICIYHKQDVYAKLCLTSDPENALTTKIINGGGQSPVFDDIVRLNVRTLECSLKCEIWMMSRVRNYMEDQLLGFALVPLSELFIDNGKLDQELPLSSTDLFHSPAGFVKLSFSYNGEWPEVIHTPVSTTSAMDDKAFQETHPVSLLEKIEFPDPKVVSENDLMVSEYFSIRSNNIESQGSDDISADTDTKNQCNSGITDNEVESPISNLASLPTTSLLNEESIQPIAAEDTFSKPVVSVNIEPEIQVVQQDIVDMYMKSMHQFTESLAKMKLPLDSDDGPTSSENSSPRKSEASKISGSRVFYGSGAFF